MLSVKKRMWREINVQMKCKGGENRKYGDREVREEK